MRPLAPHLLLAATAWMACPACGSGKAPARVEITVFAASSLTEGFRALEQGFERAHPNVDVQLAFAGSQVLRLQIEQGARADIFASADAAHVEALRDAGLVSSSRRFAHNELAVIVPPDNPAGIATFDDLPRARRIVVGTEAVPVGSYAQELLARARERFGAEFASTVRAHIVSEEGNVRLVRAKVELGEADAAIVYRTDAAASDRVRSVPVPETVNVRASYLIAAIAGSAHPEHAAAFVDYALSDAGQHILATHGFVTEGTP